MFSYELVSNGEYHRVEMLAIKKKFTLRVDGGIARSIVNEGENEFRINMSLWYITLAAVQCCKVLISFWQ